MPKYARLAISRIVYTQKGGNNLEQYYDFLLSLPLFEGLNKQELSHLLECAHARVETVCETSLFWQQAATSFEGLKRAELPYLLKRVETASVIVPPCLII